MSLFANDKYRWRETYFVLFRDTRRPDAAGLRRAIEGLGAAYHVNDVAVDEDGGIESLTVLVPSDFAAMDISYVSGEEVQEQIEEIRADLKGCSLTKLEKSQFDRLNDCNARFDIYHFEQVPDSDAGDEEDEYMDPGSLLAVMKCLAELCDGIRIDPQSETFM